MAAYVTAISCWVSPIFISQNLLRNTSVTLSSDRSVTPLWVSNFITSLIIAMYYVSLTVIKSSSIITVGSINISVPQ